MLSPSYRREMVDRNSSAFQKVVVCDSFKYILPISFYCCLIISYFQISSRQQRAFGLLRQETTAMLFAYTNATLLLKWSKERYRAGVLAFHGTWHLYFGISLIYRYLYFSSQKEQKISINMSICILS